jgi:transforming growth factor-beta-induced protein
MFIFLLFTLNKNIHLYKQIKFAIMKKITLSKKLMMLFVAIITLSACSNDDDNAVIIPEPEPSNTIVDLALSNPDLSSLVSALQATGLDEVLLTENGTDSFTVFAPTNEAFSAFLQANGFSGPEQVPTSALTNILLNHVLSGTVQSGNLSTGYVNTLATGAGDNPVSLYVNTSGGVNLNGVSSVTSADNVASNGVVHVVDAVIPVPTVVDHALANGEFTTLVAALTRTSFGTTFTDLLSGDTGSPFTVFAPTNQAFQDLLTALGFASLDDVPDSVLQAVLTYHVVGNANVRSTDLSDDQVVNSLSEESFTIDLDNGAQIIDGTPFPANIIATDVQAGNGVIHAIDKVILPPSIVAAVDLSIGSFVVFDANFSTLESALVRIDLLSAVLDADADLTVFAPNNNSFDTFLTNSGLNSLDDVPTATLTQVVLNHVIGQSILSSALTNTYASTLATESSSGNNLSMYINVDNGVTLNGGVENGGATVIAADVEAANGVIHVIDNVLSLPTVVTFAVADETFSSLVAALTREESFSFVETLSTSDSPAPFTVFAPTNQAFADLLTELSLNSLADIPTATLEATLNTHVVAGANVLAADLTDGQTITTLGDSLTVDLSGPSLVDENARVANIIVTDVQASNGVIHVLNKVVLPNLN